MEGRNTRSPEFDQGDLVSQLREKVRTQAQRLRSLEQYRILCEQRIQELQPGHNFPVRPEDLGTVLPPHPSQDLQLAKQKISRLEQQLCEQSIKVPLAENYTFPPPATQLTLAQLQELYSAIYYQHHDLIKEKSTIEESLRAEMLNCEEQRAYIEVLKQALECNLQELGISGRNLEGLIGRQETGNNGEGPNAEIKDLTGLLKIKSEECSQMSQERMKTDKHLQEAAEALQYAEDEVQRLEEEKSILLDYIEEQGENEKKRIAEIERLVQERKELESRLQGASKEISIEISKRKEIEKEVEIAKSESSRYEKDLKQGLEEQVKEFTSQIASMEKKIESLQDNNATLSGTLKETQEELDSVKVTNASSIKEVSMIKNKSEEVEKTSHKVFETNRELETRLAKAEKEIKYYKEKKIKEVESHFHGIQEKLTNEIEELKQDLENLSNKDQESSKENLELRKKLKKVCDDYSKYQETSTRSEEEGIEIRRKYDTSQIAVQQLQFEKDKLQSDLQRLEFSLNSEKSSLALAQDENDSLRSRLEDSAKASKSLNESNREKANLLENQVYEMENLKKSLSLSLSDTENERQLKTQYYEEVMRLKKLQTALSHSGTHAEESKKAIANFSSNFGAVSSASNSYNSIISSQFKEILFKSNDFDNIDLSEWVQSACEELEALIRRLSEYKQDLTAVTQKLSMTQRKIDNSSIDESALRDRERTLRAQLDSLGAEKEKLQNDREIMVAKLQNSQTQLSGLRKDLQAAVEEAQRLRDQLNYSTTETVQWRSTAETDVFAIRASEEKANLLLKEKKELETLLGRLQSAVPSSDLQRVFLEIMKCHSELEIINRESLRIESQLLRSEGEMRSFSRNHQQEKAIQVRREVESLRGQLSNCDSQIMSYRRRMIALDEEMQDVEKCERRRFGLHLDTEKEYVQMQSQLEFKNKELQQSPRNFFDTKRKQEATTEKKVSFMSPQPLYNDSSEDRPLLSYFDKLRRARDIVSDLKDQE